MKKALGTESCGPALDRLLEAGCGNFSVPLHNFRAAELPVLQVFLHEALIKVFKQIYREIYGS